MLYNRCYILNLIQSVRNKPRIWGYPSNIRASNEEVEKGWIEVVEEVQEAEITDEITVNDVRSTWRSLYTTYIKNSANGNRETFEFFNEMEFLGEDWMWLPESYLEDEKSKPKQLILLHYKLHAIMAIILCYFLVFEVNGVLISMPENLVQQLGALLFIFTLLIGLFPIFASLPPITMFYSSWRIPLIWPPVLIYLGITFINKTVPGIMSTSKGMDYAGAPLFMMGCLSLTGTCALINSYAVKRPFPPSRILATLHFVLAVCWAYVVYLLNGMMIDAHWIFKVIPLWVVSNACLSAAFHCYLWQHVDSLFPNFNENKFEMVHRQNSPYHIEFKQKPRNTASEIKKV